MTVADSLKTASPRPISMGFVFLVVFIASATERALRSLFGVSEPWLAAAYAGAWVVCLVPYNWDYITDPVTRKAVLRRLGLGAVVLIPGWVAISYLFNRIWPL
ncbi:MAG: hypothetical protein HOP28_11410 [Gemmatimonadales bacterium]|nr:hypothetical protein [Gemmatimonadales bacterium]